MDNPAPLSTQTVKDQQTLELQRDAARKAILEYVSGPTSDIEKIVQTLFPGPKQLRVIRLDSTSTRYRVVDGVIQSNIAAHCWSPSPTFVADEIRALYDLLENPVISHG